MNEKKGFLFAYELQQKAEKEEAEILIYSQIVSSKWSERDPEITASDFDKLLKEAKSSGASKLRLRINCPGGNVWQAVAMKTMLNMSGFEEINVDIEGLCASAATFFVCVHNAHVRIAQGSEFMIHNPSTYCCGTVDDFMRTANRLTKMQKDQHEMYASRTGQTPEQIKQWMDAETWFTAKETVEHGFADELMEEPDVAACASEDGIALMRQLYISVPQEIGIRAAAGAQKTVSHVGSKASGEPTSEHNNTNEEGIQEMEIKELTQQQLSTENPELHNAILQQGVAAERQRIQQIDDMTPEGFEEMAQTAKVNGTSSADFLRQVVAEQKKRRRDYMGAREQETGPAQEVTGGASADNDAGNSEADEINHFAKEMAEMAKEYRYESGGSMY